MPKSSKGCLFALLSTVLLAPVVVQADSHSKITIPVERDSARLTSGSSTPAVTGTNSTAGGDSSLWELFSQLEQLQEEVRRLNGLVEEQNNVIEQMRSRQRDRYLDLDHRITELKQSATAQPPVAAVETPSSVPVTPPVTIAGAPQPEEKALYKKAQGQLGGKNWSEAKTVFQSLLQQYPNGFYQPYAHYWLGEVNLVIQDADVNAAKRHFETVVSQFPDHVKVPASLYKLARIYDSEGNNAEATKLLTQVISTHSGSTPAKLAEKYLEQMKKR